MILCEKYIEEWNRVCTVDIEDLELSEFRDAYINVSNCYSFDISKIETTIKISDCKSIKELEIALQKVKEYILYTSPTSLESGWTCKIEDYGFNMKVRQKLNK